MKKIMVRYKLKPEYVELNESLVRDVFKALAEKAPEHIRYVSFKGEDGLCFTHLVSIETKDGENPLLSMEAFKAFTSNIRDRCDEPPVATTLTEIGSYNF